MKIKFVSRIASFHIIPYIQSMKPSNRTYYYYYSLPMGRGV